MKSSRTSKQSDFSLCTSDSADFLYIPCKRSPRVSHLTVCSGLKKTVSACGRVFVQRSACQSVRIWPQQIVPLFYVSRPAWTISPGIDYSTTHPATQGYRAHLSGGSFTPGWFPRNFSLKPASRSPDPPRTLANKCQPRLATRSPTQQVNFAVATAAARSTVAQGRSREHIAVVPTACVLAATIARSLERRVTSSHRSWRK